METPQVDSTSPVPPATPPMAGGRRRKSRKHRRSRKSRRQRKSRR
jgi:hypothetical protein